MPSGRQGVLAAAGVVVALFVVSPSAVPLYDGVGFPDEAYRYVEPPTGSLGNTPPPTSVHGRLKIVKGKNADFTTLTSAEMGPQVILNVPPAALTVAGAATYVDVDVRPVRATAPPADAVLDSNVYDATLTSQTGPITVLPIGEGIQLTLRAIQGGPPDPVMDFRAGPSGSWQHLTTEQNGQDTYAAVIPGNGQVVLVQPGPRAAASAKSAGNGTLYSTVAALVVGLLLALLGIRLLARKKPA